MALLSNLLVYLALPGGPWPLVCLICIVPLGLALHGASPRSACFLCLGFGLVAWLGSLGGLATAASGYLQLSRFESILYILVFCIYCSLPYGIFGYLHGVFQCLRQPFGVVVTSACFTLLLCLFPNPMPMSIESALYPQLPFIQVLELGGRPLLLFALALINWSVVALALQLLAKRNPVLVIALLVSVPSAMLIYGQLRLANYQEGGANMNRQHSLSVALLQPNFTLPHLVADADEQPANPFDIMLEMSEQVLQANPGLELVLWPEIPERIDCAPGASSRNDLKQMAQHYAAGFLISCVQAASAEGEYNSAMMVSNTGDISTYHKQIRFPFAEFLPGESTFPWLRRLLPAVSHYLPGERIVLFDVPGEVKAFSAICYEILFSDHIWKFVAQGGEVLVNPVNDAWFGESRIRDFMVAASVFQAIQFRIPVLRVSNSGHSLFVRSSGSVSPQQVTADGQRAVLVVKLTTVAGDSPRFYPAQLCTLLLFAIWSLDLISRLRRRWAA